MKFGLIWLIVPMIVPVVTETTELLGILGTIPDGFGTNGPREH